MEQMDKIPEGYNIEQFAANPSSVIGRAVWNAAVEASANELHKQYPDHKWTNAYSAAIRMLKK